MKSFDPNLLLQIKNQRSECPGFSYLSAEFRAVNGRKTTMIPTHIKETKKPQKPKKLASLKLSSGMFPDPMMKRL